MTDHNANPVGAAPESRILEARLRLFARHMADCENAAKAARLAGYSDYPGTSRATGSRLMQDPAVVAMVEVERRERAQRLRVSEERIVGICGHRVRGFPLGGAIPQRQGRNHTIGRSDRR
jgi:hypothetical protein